MPEKQKPLHAQISARLQTIDGLVQTVQTEQNQARVLMICVGALACTLGALMSWAISRSFSGDQDTQQNPTLVEQMAAAAEALNSMAAQQVAAVAVFDLGTRSAKRHLALG